MSYSYLQYQTLRELLWTAHDLGDWLENKGYPSIILADCSLQSYRTIAPYWEFAWSKLGHPDRRANAPLAAAAGLGEIGLSGLLLHPEAGPRHQFVFLATTAELPETPKYAGPALCAQCGGCVDACPAHALYKTNKPRGKAGIIAERDEEKCQWTRSLGMVAGEGPGSIGWQNPKLSIPAKIDDQNAQKALDRKDPLQVIGYRYPCQVDVIIERCLQACPVGRR